MEDIYSNSSESEYENSGPLPTDMEEDSIDHSNRRSELYPDNRGYEFTDCLHYKGKKYEDLVMEVLEGVKFKSVAEVDQFYSYYSLAIGFSVRKHKADKNSEQQARQGEQSWQPSKKQKF